MKPGLPGDHRKLTAAAAKLRQRFNDLDVSHDIPSGIGCNVDGTVRYIDKDLFDAIIDGKVDTGLTPEQTIECLAEHIEAEKIIAEQDNGIEHWADISLLAHHAEADKVVELGGNVEAYDQALAPLFIACKQKEPKNPAPDLMDLEADDGQAQQGSSGLQGGGIEDRQGAGDSQSGRGPGERDEASEPRGEASQPPA